MGKEVSLKIGVIGVGYLGNFHLQQLKKISNVIISGLYDANNVRAEEMSKKYGLKSFSSLESLFNSSKGLDIGFSLSIN